MDRQFPEGAKQMASKQVKRCRPSLVIKKRLIEIRDIILLAGEARLGALLHAGAEGGGPFPGSPPAA